MKIYYFLLIVAIIVLCSTKIYGKLPLVINTWNFINATREAWSVLNSTGNPLDAIVEGCSVCEREQCGYTVGYGGSPDETGETSLDAMIMNGSNLNMGAVANLRKIKNAIRVAKHVLIHTEHSLLAGDQATDFAMQMGFKWESLFSKHSKKQYKDWVKNKCQPNFWTKVVPDSKQSCGPYKPENTEKSLYCDNREKHKFGSDNHDTIGMIVINKDGDIFAGTSTNGAIHKIPGRVGDSPIAGAGAYCNNNYGAAAATGDGDVMMRNLPSFLAVEQMRNGRSPQQAAKEAIERLLENYSKFSGAIIVADRNGNYAAACNNIEGGFPFSVADESGVRIERVTCSYNELY